MTHCPHLMGLTERFHLNPSNWIPHLSADGLYEMGTRLEVGVPIELGEQVPIPCMSLYNALWLVCYRRRAKRNGEDSRGYPLGREGLWEHIWSFLSDVDIGAYDTTNWVEIDEVRWDGDE